MNLEAFLARQDDTEILYELEDGELLAMPPESDLNRRIASFLYAYFLQLGISFERLSQKTEVVVPGFKQAVRIPDLMVLSEATAIALENATRSTIMPDMPPPELVIEVVSPGQKNIARDYRYKRAQYQARGIEEYWIVDPLTQQITVLTMNEWLYDEAVFTKDQAIAPHFSIKIKPKHHYKPPKFCRFVQQPEPHFPSKKASHFLQYESLNF
ncbi:MAG: Uma2 family endonuclease [Limnothrix sp. RL_2_0]|nr:Uma2 family endonuclease [Limnothrix sp. RL_2_0]